MFCCLSTTTSQGHDFFKLCGDVFSCHVIDNPDIASEVSLLRSVGPDVPTEQVLQLSVLFAELRVAWYHEMTTFRYISSILSILKDAEL